MGGWDILSDILKDHGLDNLMNQILQNIAKCDEIRIDSKKIIHQTTKQWSMDNPHTAKEIVTEIIDETE